MFLWLGLFPLLLIGCAAPPNALNYATADAMEYRHVAVPSRHSAAQLAADIRKITHSDEHKRMQGVLADLPADMTRCLVVEIADVNNAETTPAVIAVFCTGNSLGYLSNFSISEDGSLGQPGGGWNAAVWDAPEDAASLFPSEPASLLSVTDASTQPGTRTVVIVTLAGPKGVVSVAGFADEHPAGSGKGKQILFLARTLHQRLGRPL